MSNQNEFVIKRYGTTYGNFFRYHNELKSQLRCFQKILTKEELCHNFAWMAEDFGYFPCQNQQIVISWEFEYKCKTLHGKQEILYSFSPKSHKESVGVICLKNDNNDWYAVRRVNAKSHKSKPISFNTFAIDNIQSALDYQTFESIISYLTFTFQIENFKEHKEHEKYENNIKEWLENANGNGKRTLAAVIRSKKDIAIDIHEEEERIQRTNAVLLQYDIEFDYVDGNDNSITLAWLFDQMRYKINIIKEEENVNVYFHVDGIVIPISTNWDNIHECEHPLSPKELSSCSSELLDAVCDRIGAMRRFWGMFGV